MSQPLPTTTEPTPPRSVLAACAAHIAAITSGAEPFGTVVQPSVARTDDQAIAPDDATWTRIPGPGTVGKDVCYRTLTALLSDCGSTHAARIGQRATRRSLRAPPLPPHIQADRHARAQRVARCRTHYADQHP